jgi:hypothetical protein
MSNVSTRVFPHMALAVTLVLFVAASAAPQDVKYNAMPGTDFSKFKTYKWVTIENVKYPDQIVDQQIKIAVDSQLSGKGLARVESDTADLYIAYQVAIGQERQLNTYGMGGPWRYGGGMGTTTTSTINIGSLDLDVYDRAAQQLIWRGTATKTLDENPNPEKRQKNLNKAMTKLLKNYPPPVKK